MSRRFGLDEEQVAWRRANRAQLRGLAAQEYAEDAVSCFRASGECVFELEAIDQALAESGEPWETRDNRRLMIWLPAQAGKQYIIGVDTAGGGSEGDYACAQVVERVTGMQCAELHGHFPPRELAGKVMELGNLYNQALLVVERNNHGYGVLAHLRAENAANVFRDGGQDGWLTSAVTRPAMIENLAAVLATQPELFRSPRLLNECRTFVRHPDGNSGAAAGAHDDCVMAMAIALGVRQRAAGQFSRRGMEMGSLPRESIGKLACSVVTAGRVGVGLGWAATRRQVEPQRITWEHRGRRPRHTDQALPIIAVQHVRRMRGGAQGHLMRCSDGNFYVVKFRNNPQHLRVLANEMLATRLADAVGLPVPTTEVVEASDWLIEHTPELRIQLAGNTIRCEPGLQFGSRYVVSPLEGQSVRLLSHGHAEEGAKPGDVCGNAGAG